MYCTTKKICAKQQLVLWEITCLPGKTVPLQIHFKFSSWTLMILMSPSNSGYSMILWSLYPAQIPRICSETFYWADYTQTSTAPPETYSEVRLPPMVLGGNTEQEESWMKSRHTVRMNDLCKQHKTQCPLRAEQQKRINTLLPDLTKHQHNIAKTCLIIGVEKCCQQY